MIARVFPRRTNATPDDEYAFIGLPPATTRGVTEICNRYSDISQVFSIIKIRLKARKFSPHTGAGYKKRLDKFSPHTGAGYKKRLDKFLPHTGAGYKKRLENCAPAVYAEPTLGVWRGFSC